MNETSKQTGIDIRSYQPQDEPRVLDLLRASLGAGPVGNRPPEFFRWKHLLNPFGPSFMLVAEANHRVVGLRAFMRGRFRAGDEIVHAVRAVDTATHPEFQGQGIFSRLTRSALDALRGEADLVFNTPNEKSGAGYLKMGWKAVGEIPVWIRVRRPIRFAGGSFLFRQGGATWGHRPVVDAPPAKELLDDDAALRGLLDEAHLDDGRLTTDRSVSYLRWRYGSAPLLDYRAVATQRDGRLTGLAVFRVRPRGRLWETTIAEVITRRGDEQVARQLMKQVKVAAWTDHLAIRFPVDPKPARFRSGYIRTPGGMSFMVNPLRSNQAPSPSEPGSWALALGDLEVF
jgi:GNAT superfamily N-acetyltransferase